MQINRSIVPLTCACKISAQTSYVLRDDNSTPAIVAEGLKFFWGKIVEYCSGAEGNDRTDNSAEV
jgi:hypothetical protein